MDNDCWNRIGVYGDGSCPLLAQHIHCRNCPVYSAAGRTLFERSPPTDYLAERTGHFTQARTAKAEDTHSVVVFRIGLEWLALPTKVCREVATSRIIHSLPHRRNGAVLGLANVRGELLICVSLEVLLGLDQAAVAEGKEPLRADTRRLLVVSRDSRSAVFPADEVPGVQRFHPAELKEVPATVASATATYTRAILPWRDRTVGCLDEQRLFLALDRNLA